MAINIRLKAHFDFDCKISEKVEASTRLKLNVNKIHSAVVRTCRSLVCPTCLHNDLFTYLDTYIYIFCVNSDIFIYIYIYTYIYK